MMKKFFVAVCLAILVVSTVGATVFAKEVVKDFNKGPNEEIYRNNGEYLDIYKFSDCLGNTEDGRTYVLSPNSEIKVVNGATEKEAGSIKVGAKTTRREGVPSHAFFFDFGDFSRILYSDAAPDDYADFDNDKTLAGSSTKTILKNVPYRIVTDVYYKDGEVSEKGVDGIGFIFADSVEEANRIINGDSAVADNAPQAPEPVPAPVQSTTAPQSAASETKVVLRGAELKFEMPIINKGGRTYYPLRELFNAMGATVDWDNKTGTASGYMGVDSVDFIIGSNVYRVNGTRKEMDAFAFIENGRTYIPIRYAAEGLGYTVEWDEATKTITIK